MKRVVLVYGPTACGKSALALDMAEKYGGIIINADSMQLYDALPLLTAQPNAEDRARAPHRLYGFLAPSDPCSAGRWQEMAVKEIKEALSRGHVPIITGGTGFYLKALIHGLSPIPPVPDAERDKARKLQEELGNPAFHHALSQKDPIMAARLAPNDTQRLIRAWEVLEATGKSLSYWQTLPPEAPPAEWIFEKHFIDLPRAELYCRCDARFDGMIKHGALEEVSAFAALLDSGALPQESTITKAIGFRPLRDFIENRCGLEEAISRAKQETRNYAKRQITWFRNQF